MEQREGIERVAEPAATRGSTFRGMVRVLEREQRLAAVEARVSPQLRTLLQSPPSATAWVELVHMEELTVAIEDVVGPGASRRITRAGIHDAVVPLLASFLTGVVRLFGASPHALFVRLPDIVRVVNRGAELTYRPTSQRAGTIRASYPTRRAMPRVSFESTAGGIEVVFDLCRVRGVVSPPSIVPNGEENAADFDVQW